jgi:hypothetical protein
MPAYVRTAARSMTAALLPAVLTLVLAGPAPAQLGEYGDAPEGQMAYPGGGIPGQFPTCLGGPSGVIRVAPNAPPFAPNCWFGPTWDNEFDGNAGICPPPPYEQDECFGAADGDGGLVFPDAFTFDPSLNVGVTCFSPGPPRSLGTTCGTAVWGTDIDIQVHNSGPDPAYINVLVDWNHDGRWGGASLCGINALEEWMIKDILVPPFYHGTMIGLAGPSFQIGPDAGYTWFRFVISDRTIQSIVGPFGWDGALPVILDAGEIEDYMLKVEPGSVSGELGDAPEGALAYPPEGVMGQFPTCFPGEGSYVLHLDPASLHLGPTADLEPDGNAGNCTFPDYDRDECGPMAGGDAGLVTPTAWTIDVALNYATCPGAGPPVILGESCGIATTGPNLDVEVHNATSQDAYLNILVDWDRNGLWNGSTICALGGSMAPEHLVVNQVVPAGFSGLLSQLASQSFYVPPMPGYNWIRVSVTDVPVGSDWDGSGTFSKGETEDYLVEVGGPGLGEYGDAPESGPAYPSIGVTGHFPTCVAAGPDGFIYHRGASGEMIGAARDFESEGNGGPPCDFAGHDQDECGATPGGDSGLLSPDAFTIDPSGTAEVPCAVNATRPLGLTCGAGQVGTDLDVRVTSTLPFDLYFNLLIDWNQDGRWFGVGSCGAGHTELEHMIQNLVVPPFYSGPISGLMPGTTFQVPAQPGYVWARATLSDQMVNPNWDGTGFFTYGETEDYLLYIASTTGTPPDGVRPQVTLELGPALPNPSHGTCTIHYVLPAAGRVRLAVFDVSGRLIVDVSRDEAAGPRTWTWDGLSRVGTPVNPGLYLVKLETAGHERTMKIVRSE